MKHTFHLSVLAALVISPLQAQNDVAAVREKTEKAHLVGHEDELLLKRIDDAIAEWDPRNLTSPYLKEMHTVDGIKHALRRPDLAEFIADPDAAIALGKALFWDMQAGSDSKSLPAPSGMACATCHYRFGADARDRNTKTIAYQSWTTFVSERMLTPGGTPPFDQRNEAFMPDGITPISVSPWTPANRNRTHDIIGSQGVVLRRFVGLGADGTETSAPVLMPTWGHSRADMFAMGGNVDATGTNRTRQITLRNSPSAINAVFNDRQFHDGRAESTFNGFSVFGDFDKRVILKKAFIDKDGRLSGCSPVSVAVVNASLASQAVGPIVNEVEMSYLGRNFHDIAYKLLKAQPLASQTVAEKDSVLGSYVKADSHGLWDKTPEPDTMLTYRTLIQRAFRKEWWAACEEEQQTVREKFKPVKEGIALSVKQIGELFAAPKDKAKLDRWSSIARSFTSKKVWQQLITQSEAQAELVLTEAQRSKLIELANAQSIPVEAFLKWWRSTPNPPLPLALAATVSRAKADADLFTYLCTTEGAEDSLMINNFGLFWGLSIMLYESTLISNDSPFDQMMRGKGDSVDALWAKLVTEPLATTPTEPDNDPDLTKPGARRTDEKIRKVQLDKLITKNAPPVLTGTAMFQRGFRVFMMNCAECHEPPFFTSAANMELDPDVPEPIAKLHAHSLIRTALADAFKSRLVEAGQPAGKGVTDANRHLLGARRFFFDQERIPEVEASIGELMIENMGVPDKRPISFNTAAPLPGQPAPDRVPMITWADWVTGQGTRPLLEYRPSPQPGEKPLEPYAFYDLGFYNLGVTEPRYDWGVWKFAMDSVAENFHGFSVTAEDAAERDKAEKAAEAIGGGSLGSAYLFPRRATNAPAAAGQGVPGPEDHSQERSYLSEGERSERHFFKRARRMVMTEESWGHRKPFISDNELMGWGAFKTPSLRNVALTEPYMHNGRLLTLRQVLKFYSFDNIDLIPAHIELNPDLHPEMGRLALNSDGLINDPQGKPTGTPNLVQIQDAESLLFFLHCLTDDRVQFERAPFDHPSIIIPNGFGSSDPNSDIITVSEVGADGLKDAQNNPAPRPQFPTGR